MAWLNRIHEKQARQLVRHLESMAANSRDVAGDRVRDVRELAHEAGATAGHIAGDLADFGRHEAPIIAAEARRRLQAAGAAVRRDPLPAAVGVFGAIMLASLVMARRRR